MLNKPVTVRGYLRFVGVIFVLIAAAHTLRVANDWPVVIGGWEVPDWASFVALMVSAALAGQAYRLSRQA